MNNMCKHEFSEGTSYPDYSSCPANFQLEAQKLPDHYQKQNLIPASRTTTLSYGSYEITCSKEPLVQNLGEKSIEINKIQPLYLCNPEVLPKEEFEQCSLETEKLENSLVDLPASCINSSTSLKNQSEFKAAKIENTVDAPKKRRRNDKGSAKRSSTRKHREKSKQSISKNNIRNFLTPVIRMKQGYFFLELLKQEGLSVQDYESFLKEHFYQDQTTKLNIRQTTLNNLMDTDSDEQLLEKKVLAITISKLISIQFAKLIHEKCSLLSNHEIKQQFEWINGINFTLIEFLNSLEE